MKLFDIPDAHYYCGGFNNTAGACSGSLAKYVEGNLRGGTSLREGTPTFNEYRDCALREVERNLLLSMSNYRRALDLMIPGASSWSFVTLYYSSFYAARAVLGMFGGLVGRKVIVEVSAGKPGQQELVIKSKKKETTYTASHEQF